MKDPDFCYECYFPQVECNCQQEVEDTRVRVLNLNDLHSTYEAHKYIADKEAEISDRVEQTKKYMDKILSEMWNKTLTSNVIEDERQERTEPK